MEWLPVYENEFTGSFTHLGTTEQDETYDLLDFLLNFPDYLRNSTNEVMVYNYANLRYNPKMFRFLSFRGTHRVMVAYRYENLKLIIHDVYSASNPPPFWNHGLY